MSTLEITNKYLKTSATTKLSSLKIIIKLPVFIFFQLMTKVPPTIIPKQFLRTLPRLLNSTTCQCGYNTKDFRSYNKLVYISVGEITLY